MSNRPINREDAILLSAVLLYRVSSGPPHEPDEADVTDRLREAGARFRGRARPLTSEELLATVDRLKAAG